MLWVEERSGWLGAEGSEKSCIAGHLELNLGSYVHAQCTVLPNGTNLESLLVKEGAVA